jgi:single-strand DNA-binding protein
MSYERITLVGNLGADPEMRYTPNGQAVTNFSLATNKTYKKDGENVKETKWWRVSCWGQRAETANQYLKKGSKVLIEGRMDSDKETGGPRVYEHNGEWKANYEVVCDNFVFMDSKEKSDEYPF